MRYAGTVATWVALLASVIGGSVWVGAVASDVEHNKQDIDASQQQLDKLRDEGPPAIARLEAKTDALKEDVGDIKRSQAEILKELRKK